MCVCIIWLLCVLLVVYSWGIDGGLYHNKCVYLLSNNIMSTGMLYVLGLHVVKGESFFASSCGLHIQRKSDLRVTGLQ